MLECWEARSGTFSWSWLSASSRSQDCSKTYYAEFLIKCRVLRPESPKQRMLECWEAEAAEYDEVGDFTQELAERLVRQADLQPNQSVPLSS